MIKFQACAWVSCLTGSSDSLSGQRQTSIPGTSYFRWSWTHSLRAISQTLKSRIRDFYSVPGSPSSFLTLLSPQWTCDQLAPSGCRTSWALGSILPSQNWGHPNDPSLCPSEYISCLFLRPNSYLVLFLRTWISTLCLTLLLTAAWVSCLAPEWLQERDPTFLLPVFPLNPSGTSPANRPLWLFSYFLFQVWGFGLFMELYLNSSSYMISQLLRPIAFNMVHMGPYTACFIPLVLKSRKNFRKRPSISGTPLHRRSIALPVSTLGVYRASWELFCCKEGDSMCIPGFDF